MKNNIELSIGSKFDGEGFTKLNTALKSSAGNVRRVGSSVGQMLGAMEGLEGGVGKLAKTAGGLLGGFLSMGIWGGVIAAATSLFGWLGKIHEEHMKNIKAMSMYSDEWKTAEGRAKAYQKRVAEWKEAAKDREDAEAQAANAAKKAAEAEAKAMDKKMQMEKEYDQYLMKTAAIKERIAGLSEDEIAVNSAKRQVEFANKWGGQMEQGEAGLALELAQKKAAEAAAAQAEADKQRTAAAMAAADAERKNAEAKQKEAEAAEKTAKIKDATDKKVADLDTKIAAAKEEAARLEENAARSRGKSVGEWKRGERELAREKQKEDHKQKIREQNVDQEIARLTKFSPKALTKGQRERLADLMQWKANQDPKNNPALKEAERLEKEKMDLIAKTQRDIADISRTLKDNTTL